MLFVITGKAKAGTIKERIARRVDWQHPEGMRVVAEYWPMASETAVIAIAETDNVALIMKAISDWDDVFDFTVVPAMTAEQGLELARQSRAGTRM
jgi:hypothetical protein